MSTPTMSAPTTADPAVMPGLAWPEDHDQVVEMRGVGWAGYKAVARLRRGRSRPKLIYLDGDLILVSPGQPHERLNERLRMFFGEVVDGLRIHFRSVGQTTWRRRREDVAVEGDQTYYIASEPLIRSKTKVDLRVDPPPDLAIEAVDTHKADHALEVYARLRVPEVWVGDKNRVRILVLGPDGAYIEVTHSLAFPQLSAVEIFDQVGRPRDTSDLDFRDEVRRWVREVLIPRVPPA